MKWDKIRQDKTGWTELRLDKIAFDSDGVRLD